MVKDFLKVFSPFYILGFIFRWAFKYFFFTSKNKLQVCTKLKKKTKIKNFSGFKFSKAFN